MSVSASSTNQILLVDDDRPTREALRELLEDEGFAVAEAANGQAALELMTSGQALSLVVMDLEMPVMSGTELIEIMRNYTGLARLPVLIVTGNDRSVAVLDQPVVGYFRKPFQLDLFLQSVRTHIRS
jgi:two-component system, chemotaxis family, chemotaxis protein CheY